MNNLQKFRNFISSYPNTFTRVVNICDPFSLNDNILDIYPTLNRVDFMIENHYDNFIPPKMSKISALCAANGFIANGIYSYISSNDSELNSNARVLSLLLTLQSIYNTDIYGIYNAMNKLNTSFNEYARPINNNGGNLYLDVYAEVRNHAHVFLDSMFNGNFVIPDSTVSNLASLYGNGDASENYSNIDKIITEWANNNDYHLITRYRLSYNELVEKYGDKLIFKLSKRAYYIAGRGIWLNPYLPSNMYRANITNSDYFARGIYDNSLISSEFIEFANNNMEIFPKWCAETITEENIKNRFLTAINSIIASNNTDEKKEIFYGLVMSIIDDNIALFGDLKNNIVDNYITKNKFKCVVDEENVMSRLNNEIINCENIINSKYNEKLNLLMQLAISKSECDTSIGLKAINFIKSQYNGNKSFIDSIRLVRYSASYIIQISNKFIPAVYTEHTALESILKRSSESIIPMSKNTTKYKDRYAALMGVVEDKNDIYILPNTITILFKNTLQHYIGHDASYYKRYIDKKVWNLLRNEDLENWDIFSQCRNHHANYGNHSEFGNTGCQGSFSAAFNDAETSYNLNKEIALCLQYVRTLVPFDWAGNSSLTHCFVCDKETKEIISASHLFGDFFSRNRCKIENGIIKLIEDESEEDLKDESKKSNDDINNDNLEPLDDLEIDDVDELDEIFDTAF